MPSPNVVGDKLELIAKGILEHEGAVVHRAIRSYIKPKGGKPFMRSNDIFGCFDLVALYPHRKPRFIQITTAKNFAERRKKIDKKFPFSIHGCEVEVWAWHKGKGKMYFATSNRNGVEWFPGKDIYQKNGR